MILNLRRFLAVVVSVCVVGAGLPHRGVASGAFERGASTSGQAAAMGHSTGSPAPSTMAQAAAAGLPVLALGALDSTTAEPDTTEFDFPDEEHKHLVRDITAWAIASAFVAVFIIKVFIEKDNSTPPDNSPPHKTIP